MIIKISNGEVEAKEFITRKARKEINAILFGKVSLNSEGKAEGLSMEAMDRANDVAMLNLITKITIDGTNREVNLKTLDEMNAEDVQKIIDEINKITNKQIPNV